MTYCAFSISLLTVSPDNAKVLQPLPDLFSKHGESAKLQCSHSISTYDTIQWYKQSYNRRLQLMGYIVGSQPKLELEFDNKVTLKGNGYKNSTLTINTPTSNDRIIRDYKICSSHVIFCSSIDIG
uniref:Ig-like domain-containing protein n=1 Tax=Pygocentrus nattereri TaxID=42514 RepID=A0A3B4DSH5_PYGNA